MNAAEVAVAAIRRNVRAHPRRSSYVAIIRQSLELPDAAFREAFVTLANELGEELDCAAAIVEGKDFAGSAMRGVVTGMALAVRLRFPLRSFATVEEAARWITSRLGSRGGRLGHPGDLREAFRVLSETVGGGVGSSSTWSC